MSSSKQQHKNNNKPHSLSDLLPRRAVRMQDSSSVGVVERQYAHFDETLNLRSGGVLEDFTVAYETYGKLNEDRSNVIWICHALSGDSHVAGYYTNDPEENPGWWDDAVGPGKMFDTNRYFVVCPNVLGGCRGTTGPLSLAPDGKPFGLHFPVVTVADMVEAQRHLLDYFGVEKIFAIAGGSMGGMQALQWSVDYPERVENVLFIASTPSSSAQNIAFNEIGRQAIYADPKWNGGDYYEQQQHPDAGLAVARMIGHITYMSENSMEQKFGRRLQHNEELTYSFETDFAIESYLQYQGFKFTKRFDANSYLYITKALDYYDVASGYNSMDDALHQTKARFLVVSFSSDWLYTDDQAYELVESLQRIGHSYEHHQVEASFGHDSFLVEVETMTELIGGYLDNAWNNSTIHNPAKANGTSPILTDNAEEDWQSILRKKSKGAYKSMKTLTMKFGGTSVGSVEAIENLASVVEFATEAQAKNTVIIVSAMSGVTNMLKSGLLAAGKNSEEHQEIGNAIYQRHETVLNTLAPNHSETVLSEINGFIRDYVRLCDSVSVLGEVTPRALDYAMGIGERISARQIAAVLNAAGVPAQLVDATELIVTDNCFQNAVPNLEASFQNIENIVVPIMEAGQVPVITGFVGATADGIYTTIGRGGSDYSAALIGVCLESDELWIWTDVDGVMSADPNIVSDAHTIDVITYREVNELAYYGAKVLHPKTIRPALEADIPIRVKNTFNPAHPGTLVVNDNGDNNPSVKAITTMHNVGIVKVARPIKAVTAVKEVGLITIEGKGMLGVPGIAARAFGTAAQTGTNILMISQSSSEQSICFTVPCSNVETIVSALSDEFTREIEHRDIDQITEQSPLTIVTVVGAGMRHTPGIAAQVFSAIAKSHVNVIAIAQGSSECSISLLVNAADTDMAVRSIHTLTVREQPVLSF